MVLRRPDALHGQAPASPRHPCQREAPRLRAFCHGGQVAIPGVTHLGRLSHAAVADQFRRARIWAYPCSFRETSCITAMKARAGGAIPAVIPNGALRETVRFGFRTGRDFDNPGGAGRDGLVDEWRHGLIELLASPDRQQSIRRVMVPASREAFDWSHVAAAWHREFSQS